MEKHNKWKVVVGAEMTLTIFSERPLTEEQVVKRFREQKFHGVTVEQLNNKFAYLVSTEPMEEVVG